ncbi:hypothetical protein D7X33_09295 [Butyricicoccus sp. 1XD8-22]|nr:hypothetical protein D7X33_09295 [Butyricicoccus sp. 1XD8-22]
MKIARRALPRACAAGGPARTAAELCPAPAPTRRAVLRGRRQGSDLHPRLRGGRSCADGGRALPCTRACAAGGPTRTAAGLCPAPAIFL